MPFADWSGPIEMQERQPDCGRGTHGRREAKACCRRDEGQPTKGIRGLVGSGERGHERPRYTLGEAPER